MSPRASKVMTAKEAVARFVHDGASIGLGGQNVARLPMAVTHEIVRQGKKDLTLYGCSLSMQMDLLVGAGLVRRVESGTGNLERFGTTFRWRDAIEQGTLEHVDWSHLAMVTRFLAGEMGVPFMPTKSLLGTDLLSKKKPVNGAKLYEVIFDPWAPGEPVVLLPAVQPDVAIVHVQRADEEGNCIVEGFAVHEPEMVRAAKAVIVSCEEVISADEVRRYPERTSIPFVNVSAVVEQPFGAYPSSTYRYYDYDGDHITEYQAAARQGGAPYQAYLERYVYGCDTWEAYLERCGGVRKLHDLRQRMLRML